MDGGPVVLLSDFGLDDPYVGVMHGVLARHAPAARVIDLTHGVPPQSVRIAAFFLARTRAFFPAGSIFVGVVDPGVGSARRIVAAQDGGQLLLAPDNGLLWPALGPSAVVRAVDVGRFVPQRASATFHGRDVFCPLAAELARGTVRFDELGDQVADCVRLESREPAREGRKLRGEVLFADRFCNLITNVESAHLEGEPRDWRARCAGRELALVRTYAEARAGAASLLENSYGLFEIAVPSGSAERLLGVRDGAAVEFERQA
jgi:S-adenosylmethionine hydrolase